MGIIILIKAKGTDEAVYFLVYMSHVFQQLGASFLEVTLKVTCGQLSLQEHLFSVTASSSLAPDLPGSITLILVS